jgi:hypothetical protein
VTVRTPPDGSDHLYLRKSGICECRFRSREHPEGGRIRGRMLVVASTATSAQERNLRMQIGLPAQDRNLLAQIPVAQNLGARIPLKAPATRALALRSLKPPRGSRDDP